MNQSQRTVAAHLHLCLCFIACEVFNGPEIRQPSLVNKHVDPTKHLLGLVVNVGASSCIGDIEFETFAALTLDLFDFLCCTLATANGSYYCKSGIQRSQCDLKAKSRGDTRNEPYLRHRESERGKD